VDNDDINFGSGDNTTVNITSVTSITAGDVGILVSGDSGGGTVSATISGTTEITGAQTGISVTGVSASANISGVTIDDPTIGIDVNGGNATISGNHIYDNGTGIEFTNGGTGLGQWQ